MELPCSPSLTSTLPSPYKVKVLPTHDASKVRASGPGLNTTGVPASLPVEFTIDAKDAGEGLLAVQITVGGAPGWVQLHQLPSCLTLPPSPPLPPHPNPGPRGEAQEGQHPGQPRRDLPGVLRPRHDGQVHHPDQVRRRRDPLLALPHQSAPYWRRQQVHRHRYVEDTPTPLNRKFL